MKYLSSCSIVKNEYPYIFEFIKIHRALGIEHFLFFDRSDDPLQNHLGGEKDITIINYPEPNRHASAWMEGIKFYLGKSQFVQFIDIDQVLFPTKHTDLRVMLKENYDNCPAVGFNWHSFGSNNFKIEPNNSTYEDFTARAEGNCPINNHIQTIAKPELIEQVMWADPHHPPMKNYQCQLNEYKKFIPYNSPFNIPPSQDFCFIAHYFTRSKQYWSNKIKKMRADTGTSGGTMEDFDHHQTYMNAVQDTRIADFYKSIK